MNYDLPTTIKMIVDDLKYFDYLREEYAGEEDGGASRIENVEELVSKAKEFSDDYKLDRPDAENEEMIEAFLEHIALLTDTDRNKDDGKSVKLMTMHTSKGLEFNTVFMVACEESGSILSDKELQEERRLFYVAMTRAKKKLFISYSKKRVVYGQLKYRDEIIFVNEIPKKYCRIVSDLQQEYNKPSRSSIWYNCC